MNIGGNCRFLRDKKRVRPKGQTSSEHAVSFFQLRPSRPFKIALALGAFVLAPFVSNTEKNAYQNGNYANYQPHIVLLKTNSPVEFWSCPVCKRTSRPAIA